MWGEGRLPAFGADLPLALIAGPCQIESRTHALEMASALKEIAGRRDRPRSQDVRSNKANRISARPPAEWGWRRRCRSSPRSGRWVSRLSPTCMKNSDARRLAEVVDVLRIPAFLCRQTDILIAAARTGRAVTLKRAFPRSLGHEEHRRKTGAAGRPMSWSRSAGRASARYTLVSDIRALPILARETGAPVIFDATDSARRPAAGGPRRKGSANSGGARAGGGRGRRRRRLHRDPSGPRPCAVHGPNIVPLNEFEPLFAELQDSIGSPSERRSAPKRDLSHSRRFGQISRRMGPPRPRAWTKIFSVMRRRAILRSNGA